MLEGNLKIAPGHIQERGGATIHAVMAGLVGRNFAMASIQVDVLIKGGG